MSIGEGDGRLSYFLMSWLFI